MAIVGGTNNGDSIFKIVFRSIRIGNMFSGGDILEIFISTLVLFRVDLVDVCMLGVWVVSIFILIVFIIFMVFMVFVIVKRRVLWHGNIGQCKKYFSVGMEIIGAVEKNETISFIYDSR